MNTNLGFLASLARPALVISSPLVNLPPKIYARNYYCTKLNITNRRCCVCLSYQHLKTCIGYDVVIFFLVKIQFPDANYRK